MAKTLKILELPTEFQQSTVKNQVRKGVMQGRGSARARFSDWLLVGSRVVSQVNVSSSWAPIGLGLCAYGLQVVNVFCLVRGFHISKTMQEMCL